MDLVRAFCEKAVYLTNGELKAFGPSGEVTDRYAKDVMVSQGT
jgi:ABC-type polysaccharide/polyol phosphate transport system ATPase subunit